MTAKTLMIQGTASSAGKSIMVTALCRIFKQDGYSVAPFKSQNMALNSFVTTEGGEIGRSQACQAEAAGIEPSIHMNPILLKPQADATSQVIIHGKATVTSGALDYYKGNLKLIPKIQESLKELTSKYDVILIEGAGSPAEINLLEKDIANMRIAVLANAPVILVGDIDRGGVFASIVGTMDLLPEDQRRMVKGFVINKFRGDISLLEPGLDFLAKRFSIPVLGVIPYIRNIGVAQEDSVYLDEREVENLRGCPDVCVVRLPHISNYDDFDPLETSCNVRYVSTAQDLGNPDLIILPGTKSTMDDLNFLRKTGMADAIIQNVRAGVPAIGICGGYQMLGNNIYDRCRTESDADKAEGLGLLDFDTSFEVEKVTSQVSGRVVANAGLFNNMSGTAVRGYEIHMGRSESQIQSPVFEITESTGESCTYVDGSTNQSGTVFGTYMHGLFNNAGFTAKFLDNLCSVRGKAAVNHASLDKEKAYNDLASTFRENLNMKKIYQILSGGIHG